MSPPEMAGRSAAVRGAEHRDGQTEQNRWIQSQARPWRRRRGLQLQPAQVRERKLGDLFEYDIEHPVTIRRNQAALVPIVLRAVQGPARAAVQQGKSVPRTRCAVSSSRTRPA